MSGLASSVQKGLQELHRASTWAALITSKAMPV